MGKYMKSSKKLITGIITAAGCALAALITVSILLPGKSPNKRVVDNSISQGYVSPVVNRDGSMLTPYFSAFRFETNLYEANDVTGKFSYAISHDVFRMVYNDKLSYCDVLEDTITEYNAYFVMENTEATSDLISSRNNREPLYAQQLKECEQGTVQNGIYVHEKFEFEDLDSFPFDKYSISIHSNEKEIISEFTHTEEITIPEQLFVGNKGEICIYLVECVTYDSGRVRYLTEDELCYFYYLKDGNQVKMSKTKL